MNDIIEYLKQTYNPLAIICYGSFADGTNDENSDFDALVITNSHKSHHDTSIVDDILLDVFIYPLEFLENNSDCSEFLQIQDGIILFDTNDIAKQLIEKVKKHLASTPLKTSQEIYDEIAWCKKMISRAMRGDTEGNFRLHWLLTDSLQIFCDAAHFSYIGPKKSLKWLERNHPTAFSYYSKALEKGDITACIKWIECIEELYQA